MFRLSLICALLVFAQPVLAQIAPGDVSGMSGFTAPQTSLEVMPPFPEPGQTVEVSLNDYSISSDNAAISWYVNGELQSEAANRRSLSYTAGALGTTDRVEARLQFPNGTSISVGSESDPVYLDVLLEADTYTPGFYQGASLPSNGSQVRATALLSRGDTVSSDEYVYRWKLDNNVIEGGALRGANSIIFTTPIRLQHRLTVDVYTLDGQFIAQKILTLPITRPEIQFYERNALFGTRPYALGQSTAIFSSSLTIEAVPYYFSNESLRGQAQLDWNVDGVDVASAENPFVLTVDRGAGSGSSNITFRASDQQNLFQTSGGQLQVSF